MGAPDVLVVGGGPAGSTVGGLLARKGWSVTILDRARFPRPKPCGECLNPGAVAALERLALLDDVLALDPVRLVGWDLFTDGGHRARGRFGPEVGAGLAVGRGRLDAALLARARSRGARVEEGVHVRRVRPGSPHDPRRRRPVVTVRAVGARAGEEEERGAAVVVGADGLRSVTARALGAPGGSSRRRKASLTLRLRGAGPSADRGRLVLGSGRTLGLAPVGPDLWNATVVVDRKGRRGGMGPDPVAFARSVATSLVKDWDAPPEVVGGPWGSGAFDFPVRRIAGGGVVLVGDAAGYYDPLTGQGIYRALRSAELAAGAIDTALRNGRVSGHAFGRYERALRREFGPGRRVQRIVEAVVSRRSLREFVLGRLAAAPATTSALVRVTGDARPVRSLLRPAVWMPALLGSRSTSHHETPSCAP